MKVYIVVCDCGGVAATARFFRNKPDLEYLINEVDEGYALSDGITEIDIPEGSTTICFED